MKALSLFRALINLKLTHSASILNEVGESANNLIVQPITREDLYPSVRQMIQSFNHSFQGDISYYVPIFRKYFCPLLKPNTEEVNMEIVQIWELKIQASDDSKVTKSSSLHFLNFYYKSFAEPLKRAFKWLKTNNWI